MTGQVAMGIRPLWSRSHPNVASYTFMPGKVEGASPTPWSLIWNSYKGLPRHALRIFLGGNSYAAIYSDIEYHSQWLINWSIKQCVTQSLGISALPVKATQVTVWVLFCIYVALYILRYGWISPSICVWISVNCSLYTYNFTWLLSRTTCSTITVYYLLSV